MKAYVIMNTDTNEYFYGSDTFGKNLIRAKFYTSEKMAVKYYGTYTKIWAPLAVVEVSLSIEKKTVITDELYTKYENYEYLEEVRKKRGVDY